MQFNMKTMWMLIFAVVLLISMSNSASTSYYPDWWNISWQQRLFLDVNTTLYSRTEWPVDIDMNFTYMLEQTGTSGTFDNNSIRLVEYNSTGNIMHEIPSQFDRGNGYNASTNAIGTFVFILNGTTSSSTNRSFYLYYDITENDAKSPPSYSTDLTYSHEGQQINVSNSMFDFYIDTNRSENTSGFWRVSYGATDIVDASSVSERTAEYIEYAGMGGNLSFDLRDNVTFNYGPVRLEITQTGPETEWGNVSNQTGQARITKKYYFYNRTGDQIDGGWIYVEQEFENLAATPINRSSTLAGAFAFDAERSFLSGALSDSQVNYTEPSYAFAVGTFGEFAGLINMNETGTSNYSAEKTNGRIGINLSYTNIDSNGTISEKAVFYFGKPGGASADDFRDDLVPRIKTPINVIVGGAESLLLSVNMSTDHIIYNRNETILINANATSAYDPYNLISFVNVTLDMGTAESGDDQTIILFDDGNHSDKASSDKIFGNTFNISNIDSTGPWNITYNMYDSNGSLLNQDWRIINVTSFYSVNTTVLTTYQLATMQMNATIRTKNYRNDTNITNTTGNLNITCWYNTTMINESNTTDQGNGTHFYQFNAPNETGAYILNCSVSSNNNTGWGINPFYIEKAVTYISMNITPFSYNSSNITQADNETFNITVNITNTGNGTARYVNITLQAAQNLSHTPPTQSCDTVNIGASCQRHFNITISNATIPGIYGLNATVEWYNPNTSVYTNITDLNVTVLSNPVANVSTTQLNVNAAEGYETNVGSFNVYSAGNDELLNVTFNVTGFDQNFTFGFTPQNITSLTAGNSQEIQINVTVVLWHTPGTYNGTINVSAENGNYLLMNISITVPAVTTVSVSTTPASYNASDVTQADNETFNITVNITNTGNATARYANMTLQVPPGWGYLPSIHNCGDVNISKKCVRQFNVSIPNATLSGSHNINVTAEWHNPNTSIHTNITVFNVTVLSNPVIEANVSMVSVTVGDGSENLTANFSISSVGNDNVTFADFSVNGLGNFGFVFMPQNITNFSIGDKQEIQINVSVPLHWSAGVYNGTINFSYHNKSTLINISVTVPNNRSWTLAPTNCMKAETPDVGDVCVVVVNNTGNIFVNFTVTPPSANYSAVNVTNFSLLKGEAMHVNVTYNVSGVKKTFYDTIYLVNASEWDSIPGNRTFLISLIPFVEPIINFSFSNQYIEQGRQVLISINVTDRSDTGVNITTVNITTPDNISYLFKPTKLSEIDNGTTRIANYSFYYPNTTTGNTSIRGIYSVEVFAEDNSPDHANKTETYNLTVYANLMVDLRTLSSEYYQDSEGGTINYNVSDYLDVPLNNVNTTITLKDSLNRIIFNQSYRTNPDGWVFPMPRFTMPADAALGAYNLTSFSSFYDSITNYTANKTTENNFTVTATQAGGLYIDVDTNVAWYPSNTMTFVVKVYDAGTYNPVEPDSMNLVVYAGSPLLKNVYLRSNMTDPRLQEINWSNETNSSTGPYYALSYVMPALTASGDYWAVVEATKDNFYTINSKSFKVSHGGPYDVEVTPLEDEVYREDYFDFEINIINMGDVGQDVDIEYWVTSNDNQTWYYKNLTVYTPAAANTTLTRSAYIYSSQPLGTHVIHVKVTYDIIQPSITASATFQVVQKPTGAPPSGPTIPVPSEPTPTVTPERNISIIEYPQDISIVRGWEDIRHVKVQNTGEGSTKDISVVIVGIPTPWYEVEPELSGTLPPGNFTVFVITFDIPVNAMTGEYAISIIASDGVAADEKQSKLFVFKSQQELVRNELDKVKEEYENILEETNQAEKYGKDVSGVRSILDEALIHIDRAESEFNNQSYIQALSHINTASDLIERAQDELGRTEYKPELITEGIPLWQIVLIIVVLVGANAAILVWKKKAYKKIDLREDLIKLRNIIRSAKREEPSEGIGIKGEKRKLSRVLDLLESEMNEGIITEKTYKELKKRTEKKLKKLG